MTANPALRQRDTATIAALLGCALLLHSPPSVAQSIWDKLKGKAKNEIEKTLERSVDEKIRSNRKEKREVTDIDNAGKASTASAADSPDPDAPPPDGLWQGQLVPAGKKSIIAYGNVTITLADRIKLLRYQSNGDCHAKLEGAGGIYEARFVTGQSLCGTAATIRLGADGTVLLTWEDAPNTKPGEKSYHGKLARTAAAFPRKAWSVVADLLDSFDILGFRLGMSYGDALDRIRTDADMNHEWRLISTANGKGTLSPVEIVKKGAGKGTAFVGETISLQFEAQSPDEMRVEQDPDLLARRAEIDTMTRKRAEEQQRIRAEFAQKVRSLSRADQEKLRAAREERQRKLAALPVIPEKPPLRPEGADAELLMIARVITFPRNARPHIDAVKQALIEKYGPPSHQLADGLALEWAFDSKGTRIAIADESPCDVISPTAKQNHDGEIAYYGLMPRFVSPACGLTLAIELKPEKDGGLYEMRATSYDQQRLLGDNWYRTVRLAQATMERIAAELKATKAVKAPKL